MTPFVIIISGPTCSGKTAAAIETALQNNAEIISCDSVQVYRGMDVGSAKATKEEREKVPHHLLDVADCSENFDVSRYIELTKAALKDIASRGKNVVVAGGSGFYLKSWFSAVTDNVRIPRSVEEEADKIECEGGAEALAEALLKIDKSSANFVDIKNPRRVKNALRRCMASGKSVEELLQDFAKLPCPYGNFPKKFILLERDKYDLQKRILSRTSQMFEGDALINETKKLLDLGIEKNPSASGAIGYRETIAWIKNGENSDRNSLIDLIAKNTLSLVKKQKKFFKHALGASADNVK